MGAVPKMVWQEPEDDPCSESHAVKRITQDRLELISVLKAMSDDPRVKRFLMEYDNNYEELILSNNNRLSLRDHVRELRAKGRVSRTKSAVVKEIYKSTDEHIANLRREVNVVYHQLIEVQEEEDASRKLIAQITKDIADFNAMILEREEGIPPQQLRLKEKIEAKYDSVKEERDKTLAEVERLREDFTDANTQLAKLGKSRLRVEDKIAETQAEFGRVNNDITKETQKKVTLQAGLNAGQEQYERREKDMEALRNRLSTCKQQSKLIADAIHATTVKTEKIRISVSLMTGKIRAKQYECEEQLRSLHLLETEMEQQNQEQKKRMQELEMLKEQSTHVDKVRRMLKNKVREMDLKKEAIIQRKETEKQKNQKLLEDIVATKRKMENAIKEHTDLIKQRDNLRKMMMKEKAVMQKDHMLLTLHQLANKRLTQDNVCLVAQGRDQRKMIRKLEAERDSYIRQAIGITRKAVQKADEERKMMEWIFGLMRMIAGEEMKMLETQNLYESTRNEHVLYTRHILQLRDLINNLKAKSISMTYETQKLLQERDYRDECLIQEELALQKLNRQIFILKVNLKDLKESNARLKLIIENQDMEEKNLIKITRVMKLEKLRELKGLERVVRDIDGLDLALTRRHLELHDLYKMVKLKQSLLEKGENMYNVRWKKYVDLKTSLQHAQVLRRLDRKNRTIVDRLMSCVKLLKTNLENVKLRSKGLMEEMSHPRNIHRWRNLLGRDPEAYESVRNLHKLRHAIQQKVDITTTTLTQIRLLDREYISLTTSVIMQPSPETVLQLKLYQEDLQTRYSQIKTLTKELREALDNKTDMEARRQAVNRKLKHIHDLWLKHMKKEKMRIVKTSMQTAGPMSLLTGPEGLPHETKFALRLLSPSRSALPVPMINAHSISSISINAPDTQSGDRSSGTSRQ